jgi:hypothetical protein
VVDGFHRVEAYRAEGYDSIPAIIRPMSLKEAKWAAVAANAANGLPLPPSIKREAFRRYMQAQMYLKTDRSVKSCREMAADFRGLCSKSFIQKWLVREFPRLAKRIADDNGDEYQPGDGAAMLTDPLPPIHTPLDELLQGVVDAVNAALEEAGSSSILRPMLSARLRQIADNLDTDRETVEQRYEMEPVQ